MFLGRWIHRWLLLVPGLLPLLVPSQESPASLHRSAEHVLVLILLLADPRHVGCQAWVPGEQACIFVQQEEAALLLHVWRGLLMLPLGSMLFVGKQVVHFYEHVVWVARFVLCADDDNQNLLAAECKDDEGTGSATAKRVAVHAAKYVKLHHLTRQRTRQAAVVNVPLSSTLTARATARSMRYLG